MTLMLTALSLLGASVVVVAAALLAGRALRTDRWAATLSQGLGRRASFAIGAGTVFGGIAWVGAMTGLIPATFVGTFLPAWAFAAGAAVLVGAAIGGQGDVQAAHAPAQLSRTSRKAA